MQSHGGARRAGRRHAHVTAGRAMYGRLGPHGLQAFLKAMLAYRPPGRSVVFTTAGNELVLDALRHSGHFCRDGRVGGMLHHGGTSFREIAKASGLHLTLRPGDRLSVHVDRAVPAMAAKADGGCIYGRRQAMVHLSLDVFSSLRSRHGAGGGEHSPVVTAVSTAVVAHFLRRSGGPRPSRAVIPVPRLALASEPDAASPDRSADGAEPLRRAPPSAMGWQRKSAAAMHRFLPEGSQAS